MRPAVAFRTQLTLGRVDGATAAAPLTRDMYREQRKVEAAISTLPLVWGQGLTAYLDNYAYSCTEQLVSKGMSALIIASRPEFGTVQKPRHQPARATFAVLRGRANDQGGFGLWSSSPKTAEFPTVYAAHFLVEATDRGQKIPPEILASVDDWLTRFASTPASTLADARLRAYAVYLLVRQGIKPNAALANVEQELTRRYPQAWPTDLAAAYLASTYRLMQRNDDADRIIRNVPWSTQKRRSRRRRSTTTRRSTTRSCSICWRVISRRALGTTPPAALETLSAAISGNRVQLAVGGLHAARARRLREGRGRHGHARHRGDRQGWRERALTLPAGAMPKVSISRGSGEGAVLPTRPAAGLLPRQRVGLRSQSALGGDQPGDRDHPRVPRRQRQPVITRVTVGQEFLVRLRLRATRRDRQPQIAVVDLLPGGVEPVLERQPAADSSTPIADPALAQAGARLRSLPIGAAGQVDLVPGSHRCARRPSGALRRRHARMRARSSIASARPTAAHSRRRRHSRRGCTTARSSA